MAERSLFGGFANTETDSCYHRKCDTVLNIDFGELLSNARLAAGALSTLAGQSKLVLVLSVLRFLLFFWQKS
jgi:hypothetical protein